MAIWLKQSTASQEIPLGYFLDSGDGDAEETGLTIANTDIKLWKSGATTLANKNSGGATHISNGIYYAVLDATDTNTLGPMVVFVHVSGALAVRLECLVLPANTYDSLVAGTDNLDAEVATVVAAAANKIADHTIRRTFQNACDSSDGDTKTGRSLLGAIAKLVNKVASSGGTLTVYEDDDVTSLFTQSVTTDSGADPITELDTT